MSDQRVDAMARIVAIEQRRVELVEELASIDVEAKELWRVVRQKPLEPQPTRGPSSQIGVHVLGVLADAGRPLTTGEIIEELQTRRPTRYEFAARALRQLVARGEATKLRHGLYEAKR